MHLCACIDEKPYVRMAHSSIEVPRWFWSFPLASLLLPNKTHRAFPGGRVLVVVDRSDPNVGLMEKGTVGEVLGFVDIRMAVHNAHCDASLFLLLSLLLLPLSCATSCTIVTLTLCALYSWEGTSDVKGR
jgi:hypothetical protein